MFSGRGSVGWLSLSDVWMQRCRSTRDRAFASLAGPVSRRSPVAVVGQQHQNERSHYAAARGHTDRCHAPNERTERNEIELHARRTQNMRMRQSHARFEN